MVRGTPCRRTISLKTNSAMCEASSLLWQGIKCAILLKRSTTTKIESLPLLVRGNPRTKSIEMSSQETLGMGKGVYKPWGFKRYLALWHVTQRRTYLSTSRRIFGQKKWSASTCSVFLAPKWPISLPAWTSCKTIRRTEQSGMQRLLALNKKSVIQMELFSALAITTFIKWFSK